ncbi:hypothetical protein WJX72_008917 [[Myrmecia] bisecta]|uniref:APAF-1 helical domain-containing protein n=1 Tax=[Myrmecia] bisecta TaxID=41462 RepID=A0AAW1PLM7_9CHLO
MHGAWLFPLISEQICYPQPAVSKQLEKVKTGHKVSGDSAYLGRELGGSTSSERIASIYDPAAVAKAAAKAPAPAAPSPQASAEGQNAAAAMRDADPATPRDQLAGCGQSRLAAGADHEARDRLPPLRLSTERRASVERRSLEAQSQDRRGSRDSGSGSARRSDHSRRSSFALERASMESNRASLEMFRVTTDSDMVKREEVQAVDIDSLCIQLGIPEALRARYVRLAVVPSDTPLPMSMLMRLWSPGSETDAEATANMMEDRSIMRVACLYDGSAWALVQAEHLKLLQGAACIPVAKFHAELLDSYLTGHSSVLAVPDDGYFMQNVGHHLVGAERLKDLKALLISPHWLEHKLHSYGVASVVADFRRFLMATADDEVKLLLEAFQMSVSACIAHPDVAMLACQMVGRLMAVSQSHLLQGWMAEREAPIMPPDGQPLRTRCLMPMTPSLEQAGGLQRMALRGHTGGINKVLLTPGGIDVITASADSTARVWDMEIGDCVLLLEGHTGPILDMATAADGSLLITASEDQTACVWELEKGTCLSVLEGHTGALNGVALDAYGRIAVTVAADGTARVWDLASGKCAHMLQGHAGLGVVWSVALTPDGRRAVTTSEDFTARVWDVVSGTCAHVLQGHSGWVVDVALTADASRAITASHDGTARVWDLWTGACEHVLEGHVGRINAVRVATTEKTAITVSDDFTARVWDWSTGKCMHVLEGHGGWLSDVAITYNGTKGVTVSGDDLAVVWDLHTGVCLNVLEGHSNEVRSVILTRRGRFAVTGSEDGTARVWDLQAGSMQVQRSHNGKVTAVSVQPNCNTALSVGEDGVGLVWDVATGACKSSLQGHTTALRWAVVMDDGEHALTASGDRMVKAWHLASGTCTSTLPIHQGSRVKSFAASRNGRTAVIVLFDSTVAVWDLETLQIRCMLQKWGDRDAARVHSGGVNAVYMSHNNMHAVTVSKDCTARIWNLETGDCERVLEGHTDGVTGAALSDDGQLVVTVSYDRTARLWSMQSGQCRYVLEHDKPVTSAAISPNSLRALTTTDDHLGHLWDLESGINICTLPGHKEQITDSAFSPDSTYAATCSHDCTLRLYDADAGSLEGFFMADAGLTTCSFAGGFPAKTLVVGSDSGAIHFLKLTS